MFQLPTGENHERLENENKVPIYLFIINIQFTFPIFQLQTLLLPIQCCY